MQEIWRDIEGYEGLYQVSNFGRVKSLRFGKEKIMKILKYPNGYLKINLYKQKSVKTYQLHRLVANAFIPNPNNYPIINHKDEDKTNNRFDNLEWCSYSYNNTYGKHGLRMLRSCKKVQCIETGVKYYSQSEVERQTGIPQSSISMCCNGKIKTCGGFHWRYVN